MRHSDVLEVGSLSGLLQFIFVSQLLFFVGLNLLTYEINLQPSEHLFSVKLFITLAYISSIC